MNEPPDRRRFELHHTQGVPISSEELLADLKRVAADLNRPTVTYREYNVHGRYSAQTVYLRFGSWNKALKEVGFGISHQDDIDAERLFENLEPLGRQPAKRNLGTARSEFSERPYTRAFGTWRKALEAFVDWANAGGSFLNRTDEASVFDVGEKRRQARVRDPNLNTRFLVMRRGGFRCRYCGKSPATHPGIELVLDHVEAWSKGGETVPENLVTPCEACNLGKGNM